MTRMYTKLIIALAGSLALAGTLASADDSWQISLGISYRQVGDLDLNSVAFENPSFAGSGFVTGFITDPLGGVGEVVDPARQLQGGQVILHQLSFAGGSEDMDDAPGLELNARRNIFSTGDVPWNLNLSMVWFGADASVDFSGIIGDNYTGTGIPTGGNGFFAPGALGLDPTTTLPGIYGNLSFDFDLNAWTFGVGIGPEFALSCGSISLEIGPTLTIVDYDASCEQSAFWADDDSEIYSAKESDSGVDFLFGLYVAASYAYDFTEQAGVELGARYDLIQDLDSDVATLEMSGFSLTGRLFYRF